LSFGDLLILMLFVLFVVLPAINRSQQQRRRGGLPPGSPARGPQPGAGAPRPGAGAPPAAGRQTTDAGPGQAAFPPLEEDDLARRLGEARERVRQAMGQRGGSATATPQPASTTPATDPRARARGPLVSGPPPGTIRGSQPAASAAQVDPRVRARGPLVSGPPPGTIRGSRPPGPSPLVRARREEKAAEAAAVRDLRREAPRVEVERLDERAGVPRSRGLRLAFDEVSVREGLVWQQVLSAPRSRRRLGGGPYQER